MTSLEKTVAVMNILSRRFPRLKARDLVELAATIVETMSEPRAKVTNLKEEYK